MKLVVCFISPHQMLRDIKHKLLHTFCVNTTEVYKIKIYFRSIIMKSENVCNTYTWHPSFWLLKGSPLFPGSVSAVKNDNHK